MYLNKRPILKNHIPNKLMYKYLKNILTYSKYNKQIHKENTSDEIITVTPYLDQNILTLEHNKTSHKDKFEEKLEQLEQQPIEIFEPIIDDFNDLTFINNFLYHGIRFQKHLEKLESIFKDKSILAGNYQENYYSYSDNCNNGEYISLAAIDNAYDLIYKTFIMENISLVISPDCNAIKTIYLPYEEWEKISNRETKNRYSYSNNEYQVQKEIPLSLVRAIGLPAKYFKLTNQEHLIDRYINDILELMHKYNIDLPIVDTSNYNNTLYLPKNYITKQRTKKNDNKFRI